ncbi:hypothetical protein NDU88_002367 [Pleurodeles waltl]|uniref:Uncharacterized protein n=1 Tax=Pleurodeles waltl TaxID=8319 RepID=A0AAV7M0Q0_PLEWA|nr:hypothetical protein NDU88_002367 [Pleurodeles waltl]
MQRLIKIILGIEKVEEIDDAGTKGGLSNDAKVLGNKEVEEIDDAGTQDGLDDDPKVPIDGVGGTSPRGRLRSTSSQTVLSNGSVSDNIHPPQSGLQVPGAEGSTTEGEQKRKRYKKRKVYLYGVLRNAICRSARATLVALVQPQIRRLDDGKISGCLRSTASFYIATSSETVLLFYLPQFFMGLVIFD